MGGCGYGGLKAKLVVATDGKYAEMLKPYYDELAEIDPTCRGYREGTAEAFIRAPWIDCLYIMTKDTKIGLIVLGYGKDTMALDNFFIREFYILPEYREQQWGYEAIKSLVKKCDRQDFYLYILEKNERAKIFWDSVFERNKFHNTLVDEHTSDGYEFRYYIDNKKIVRSLESMSKFRFWEQKRSITRSKDKN